MTIDLPHSNSNKHKSMPPQSKTAGSRVLSRCYNIADLRKLAQKKLPSPIFHFLDGGAEDETTVRRNTEAFNDYDLLPHQLTGAHDIDISTTVLGQRIEWPVICAPTGMSRLFHPEGEHAVARAAARTGTMYSLSTFSSVSLEEVAAHSNGGPKMFQIKDMNDKGLNMELIERCRDAGYGALCMTADTVVSGNRERDLRTGLTSPPKLTAMSLLDTALHPRWVWGYLTGSPLVPANFIDKLEANQIKTKSVGQFVQSLSDPTVSWDDVAGMIKQWGGPFAIKGVVTVSDAERASDIGASAIILSNHGGRQLDGVVATLDVLSELVEAVGDRIEIILDGGVRRGTHVLKALALGAKACMIGRPYLFGLSAGGEAGVERAFDILKSEIVRDMTLLGCSRLADLDTSYIRFVRA